MTFVPYLSCHGGLRTNKKQTSLKRSRRYFAGLVNEFSLLLYAVQDADQLCFLLSWVNISVIKGLMMFYFSDRKGNGDLSRKATLKKTVLHFFKAIQS